MEVKLTAQEQIALQKLAYREKRLPRDQAAVIIKRELERAGFLAARPESGQGAGGDDDGSA